MPTPMNDRYIDVDGIVYLTRVVERLNHEGTKCYDVYTFGPDESVTFSGRSRTGMVIQERKRKMYQVKVQRPLALECWGDYLKLDDAVFWTVHYAFRGKP